MPDLTMTDQIQGVDNIELTAKDQMWRPDIAGPDSYGPPWEEKINENSGWCVEQLHTEADAKPFWYKVTTKSSTSTSQYIC